MKKVKIMVTIIIVLILLGLLGLTGYNFYKSTKENEIKLIEENQRLKSELESKNNVNNEINSIANSVSLKDLLGESLFIVKDVEELDKPEALKDKLITLFKDKEYGEVIINHDSNTPGAPLGYDIVKLKNKELDIGFSFVRKVYVLENNNKYLYFFEVSNGFAGQLIIFDELGNKINESKSSWYHGELNIWYGKNNYITTFSCDDNDYSTLYGYNFSENKFVKIFNFKDVGCNQALD